MEKTIKIFFSEEDLEELQNGETFEWRYNTEETNQEITVILKKGDNPD